MPGGLNSLLQPLASLAPPSSTPLAPCMQPMNRGAPTPVASAILRPSAVARTARGPGPASASPAGCPARSSRTPPPTSRSAPTMSWGPWTTAARAPPARPGARPRARGTGVASTSPPRPACPRRRRPWRCCPSTTTATRSRRPGGAPQSWRPSSPALPSRNWVFTLPTRRPWRRLRLGSGAPARGRAARCRRRRAQWPPSLRPPPPP
mmetsp:Transcript_77846/g.240335  ORF Transcript_77846/g.240335 Transcript_77846/m.240335 type:complete len:207 (+) Transcript_77846:956-1576(+)